jgi:hypothetical protein
LKGWSNGIADMGRETENSQLEQTSSLTNPFVVFEELEQARTIRPQHQFAAFIDLLGISALSTDFDRARDVIINAFRFLFAAPEMNSRLARSSGFSGFADSAPEITVISDAVLMTSPDLTSLILSTQLAIGGCLWQGIPVRGCISYGTHQRAPVAGNFLLLGDALPKAYLGESQKAIYPRVILDEAALEKASLPALANLAQDEDGWWFVNPNLHWDAIEASWTVESVASALTQSAEAPRVRAKMTWLADFFNASLFGEPRVYYDQADFRAKLRERVLSLEEAIEPGPIPVWAYDKGPARRFVMPPQGWGAAGNLESIHWRRGDTTWEPPKDIFKRSFEDNWFNMVDFPWP